MVGLYSTAELERTGTAAQPVSVSTLERRLAALSAHYRSAGARLDRADRHIADVMAGIRRTHGKPPKQKEAVFAADILAMVGTLDQTLRGLRHRAMLLLGFPRGPRPSPTLPPP